MPEPQDDPKTFHRIPDSVTGSVAALIEPGLAVLTLLACCAWVGEPIDRPEIVLCVLAVTLLFPGHNHFWERPLNAAVQIGANWVTLLAILALVGFATHSFGLFDWNALLAWALICPALVWCSFFGGRSWLRRRAAQAPHRRRAVIVGAGALGVKVAASFLARGSQGHELLGYFDDREDGRVADSARTQRLGRLADVAAFVREQGVHEVYITLPLGSQPRIIGLLEAVQGTTASIYFVPDVFGISIIQGRLRDMNGLPVVGLCESPFTGTNLLVKRASDLVLASLILLLVWPFMLIIAIAVRLGSPGPAIFRQRRNGLDGEEIVVYKFRSMTTQDNGEVVHQATRDDPRVTPLGAFLRRTSLDELPQFVNVLQGRMSIVGPRPHAVAHNAQYRELIKAYMVRHKVRPGITGWAQVNGHRGETDTLEKMQARVEYDLEYLRNWSLLLDLQIVARTIKLVFFDRKAY
ncbi:MAG: undecaprenyl-phosphate glucose phosphotransferase [Rubrivivax sp.]|nr:undecaprenyl-phosphate glucose phosphotransferase [Rubrivivax sp.]